MDVETVLKSLINHKIDLSFTQHEEADLRTLSGILRKVNKDLIVIELVDTFGVSSFCYLNRYSATILSVVDYGEAERRPQNTL